MGDRREILFLALTRPSLIRGVPIEAFLINLFGCFFAGMILSGPSLYRAPFVFWLAGIPLHMIMERITAWDFHGFRTLRFWLETTAIGRTDLDAYPREPGKPEDMASSV